MNGWLLMYLLLNAWTDGRKKIIDLRITVLYFLLILILYVTKRQELHGWGILPGLLLLCMAAFRKDRIGKGDGFLVMMIGLTLGLEAVCQILFAGCVLVCVWYMFFRIIVSIQQAVFRESKNRQKEFPFAPFLLLGYGIGVWFG